jgi:hypothetical protein
MANSVKVTIELLAKDLTKAAISGVRSGLSGIASALTTIATAAAGAGASLLAFTRFAILGERDIAIAARFDGAMKSLGLSADEVKKRLEAATGGLLEQNDVLAAGTKALKDGKFTLDQTALAMEFLRLKAVSTGQDVAAFTKDGIDALSRGMARGLLPLFPDLQRQLEDLANSGMEGAHQKSEALRLVFQRMIATLPELQAQVGDTSVAAQQFSVELKNAISQTAAQIAASPATKQFFTDILASVQDLINKLPDLLPAVEKAISGIARLTGLLGKAFATAADGWNKLIDLAQKTPETLEASALAEGIAGTQQAFEGLDPDKSPAARQAFNDAKKNISDSLLQLFHLVHDGAKIEGLSTDQAAALERALTSVGVDPATGLYGKLFFGLIDPDKAAAMVRGAVVAGGAAIAAAPAKVTGQQPKVALTGLAGTGGDVGPGLDQLKQKLEALKLGYEGVGPAAGAYEDELRALSAALHDLIGTQTLSGPVQQRVLELQNQIAEATKSAAGAVREQAKAQNELDAALEASQTVVFDYTDTTIHLGNEATTVGAAMDGVAQAVQDADAAAARADLGIGSFEDAHRAAEAAKKQIDAFAQALMAAGLPADDLAARLKQLHDIEAGLGTGATQGLIDMKLLLTDITHDTLAGFTDAISGAFQAMVEGSQSAATAFKVGMLKAIAAVAAGLAQMMVGKAVEQIAEAIANPITAGQHIAAAAKFTFAAALFGALSGALSGAAANAGGGGGAGGSPSATTAAAATDKGSGTIIVQGGLLDMSDPKQADAFAKAVSDLTGRQVIIQPAA